MALMASMSATWPYRLTGMMALVRGVIAASMRDASMLQVSASTSTNTGVAPSSTIISAVAAKVKGVVMTSSPRPMPKPIIAISSASVPLATLMQWRVPTKAASRSSISLTSGPMMYWPWSSTRWMRASMRWRSAAYCAFRSLKGNGCRVSGAFMPCPRPRRPAARR